MTHDEVSKMAQLMRVDKNPSSVIRHPSTAWGITDGSAGMAAQARALAQALGVPIQMKKITLKPAFAWLPNMVLARLRAWIYPCMLDSQKSDGLSAPWPELIISCGRKAAAVAMGMKAAGNTDGQPRTAFITIQDPQCSARNFDAVIAMAHDRIRGNNVLISRYALHSITPQTLAAAREQFAPVFARYAAPRVAVLLGGSTNKYRLDAGAMEQLMAHLEHIKTASGSLLITPSRRTGEANIALLHEWIHRHSPERGVAANQDQTPQHVRGDSNVYFYDGKSENPYMGLLALADFVVVTNDSVNMMSEALASGKPVYILSLAGHANTKPARFAEGLMKQGLARPWEGRLEAFSSSWADEMPALAVQVRAKLSTLT
jgi:mitochondrial fission protein ELM1